MTVWRDGQVMEMHQDNLLVGDIVQVNEGMEIPADGILFEANEVTTDESAMTGETDPIHKATLEKAAKRKKELEKEKTKCEKHDVPSPLLLSGTKVLAGEGRMLVLVVGELSCIGKIRALLTQEEETMTPLQEKL